MKTSGGTLRRFLRKARRFSYKEPSMRGAERISQVSARAAGLGTLWELATFGLKLPQSSRHSKHSEESPQVRSY